ncbi:MAG: Ig domain-containing protein, partial [Firmicutes bacterium]|nr:Ig domain-containing protein [Bacillota bacterium]
MNKHLRSVVLSVAAVMIGSSGALVAVPAAAVAASVLQNGGCVQPIVDGVCYDSMTNEFTTCFGYNDGSSSLTTRIPLSASNFVFPFPAERGQPTIFCAGEVSHAFVVTSSGSDGGPVVWNLDGRSTHSSQPLATGVKLTASAVNVPPGGTVQLRGQLLCGSEPAGCQYVSLCTTEGTLTGGSSADDLQGGVGADQGPGPYLIKTDAQGMFSATFSPGDGFTGPVGIEAVAINPVPVAADGLPPAAHVALDVQGEAPIISTGCLPTIIAGVPYSAEVVVSGDDLDPRWVVASGSLPAGLSLNPNTGSLSGVATTVGTGCVTVAVIGSQGDTVTRNIPWTVVPALPTIAQSSLPPASAGQPYCAMVHAVGGDGPYTWRLVGGSLPPGVVLNGQTGVIAGTPSAAGAYCAVVTVTDGSGQQTTAPQSISVSAPVSGAGKSQTVSGEDGCVQVCETVRPVLTMVRLAAGCGGDLTLSYS